MAKAQYAVKTDFKAHDKVTPALKRMNKNVTSFSKNSQKQFRKMTKRSNVFARSLRTIATGFGIGSGIAIFQKFNQVFKESIMLGVDFEQSMASARAKFPGNITKTSKEFKALNDVVRKVGRETVFTANQAAQGLELLARAGLDVDQAIAALPPTVNLAIAANIELARANEISLKVLGQFNLRTKDSILLRERLTHINDVLAKSANSANLTIENMFETFQRAAPIAAAAGSSLETAATLTAALADAGIEGSIAGTTLKNAFTKLVNPVGAGTKVIKGLHLRIADSKGDFRDMVDIFSDFGQAIKKFGTVKRLKLIDEVFGLRAIAGASVIMARHLDDLKAFRQSLIDSAGASKKMADIIQDTVGGSLKRLKSATESIIISLFNIGKIQFRDLIDSLKDIVLIVDKWILTNQDLIRDYLDKIVNFGKNAKDGVVDFIDVMKLLAKIFEGIVKSIKFIRKYSAFPSLVLPSGMHVTGALSRAFLGGEPKPHTRAVRHFDETRENMMSTKFADSFLNINFRNKPDDVDIQSDIQHPGIRLVGGKTR